MLLKLVMADVSRFFLGMFLLNDTPVLQIFGPGKEIFEDQKPCIMKQMCYNYSYSVNDSKWVCISEYPQTVPFSTNVNTTSYKNTFFSVFERGNMGNALFVNKSVIDSGTVFRTKSTVFVDMKSDSWLPIKTSGLDFMDRNSMCGNMFFEQRLVNPNILVVNENKFIIAANAMDATARLFEFDNDATEIRKIDHCIEPCLINVSGQKMIFFRKSHEQWLVSCNRQHMIAYPQLLPLYSYTLDENYSIVDTNFISKGLVTGPSFLFDVCTTEDNAIVLANITGLCEEQQLQILVSRDGGKHWQEHTTFPIDIQPRRLRVIATSKRILVACLAFDGQRKYNKSKYNKYIVMASEFNR